MSDEKWDNLIGTIEEKFGIEEEIDEDTAEGGIIEGVIFKSPLGKMKIERISMPKVIDKKTLYSNRPGSATRVDYVYSDTETVKKIKVYKWDKGQDDWVEISGDGFGV